jgi:hypothetical protein
MKLGNPRRTLTGGSVLLGIALIVVLAFIVPVGRARQGGLPVPGPSDTP